MKHFSDAPELLAALFAHGDEKRRPMQAPVFGVHAEQDLFYLSDNRQSHRLDVYYPAEHSGKLPTILDIHGGAWVHGCKENNKNYCMYLASKGFTVVNINYTLAENNDLRTQVEDVNCAMHWIVRNSAKFPMDPHCLFLCGDSSGGHLALLGYLTNENDLLRRIYKLEKADVTVRALGLSSPVADLHIFTDSTLPPMQDFCRRLFGDKFRDSPYFYCSSIQDVLRIRMSMPPIWMLASEEDFFRKYSMQLDHLLNKREIAHTFRYCPKGKNHSLSHVFNVLYPEYAESLEVNNEMIDFFCAQL